MRISRRTLVVTGAVAVGLAGIGALSGLRDHIVRMVGESFGEAFARHDDTRIFAADAAQRLAGQRPDDHRLAQVFYRVRPMAFPSLLPQEKDLADWIATEFALATNVLQVIGGAEPELVYFGLYAPGRAPCRNPLSAAWAV